MKNSLPYTVNQKIKIIATVVLGFLFFSCSTKEKAPTVKSLLVQQLKNTHTNSHWFAPTNIALADLTAEQSNWKDDLNNHSIGELVSHLIFWNERVLIAFQGDSLADFNDDNETTFRGFNTKDWPAAIIKLDSIQTKWEQLTEKATDSQLKEWSTEIANICAHTAYHTGQIVYIRKGNGWWK